MDIAGRLLGIWLGAALISVLGFGVLFSRYEHTGLVTPLTILGGVGLGLLVEHRVPGRSFKWQAATAGLIGVATPIVVLGLLLYFSCGAGGCFS